MKAKNRKLRIDIFAKFLIILSFFIFGVGIAYESKINNNVLNSNEKPKKNQETSSISITPSNGSDVVSNDDSVLPTADNTSPVDNNSTNNIPVNNSGNNIGNTGVSSPITNNNQVNPENSNKEVSLDTVNDNLRKQIESEYNVYVKYGSETEGYSVADISTVSISNPSVVNNSLIRLKNVLGLYPSGMFKEINDGGIPLTIYLIDSYADSNITGVTDSSYSYANISIAVSYPIEESFYHESYHYIERYMFKKGATFNTWDSLNPDTFEYGTVYNDLSYSNTFSASAPFVNNYAQTDDKEDRASTFEYMMATSKASCLNDGQPVWKKAILMARTIDAVFDSVSPNYTEYWERFIL